MAKVAKAFLDHTELTEDRAYLNAIKGIADGNYKWRASYGLGCDTFFEYNVRRETGKITVVENEKMLVAGGNADEGAKKSDLDKVAEFDTRRTFTFEIVGKQISIKLESNKRFRPGDVLSAGKRALSNIWCSLGKGASSPFDFLSVGDLNVPADGI